MSQVEYPLKRLKTIEVDVCQGCGGDDAYYSCINCGKKFCLECHETELTNFRYSLHFSGSYNGKYCNSCSNFLLETKDPLRLKYERMEELCNTYKRFYEELDVEAKTISKQIEAMRKKRRMK